MAAKRMAIKRERGGLALSPRPLIIERVVLLGGLRVHPGLMKPGPNILLIVGRIGPEMLVVENHLILKNFDTNDIKRVNTGDEFTNS